MLFATIVFKRSFSKVLLLIITLINLGACLLNVYLRLLEALNLVIPYFYLDVILIVVVGELHQVVHVVRILVQRLHGARVHYWLLDCEVVPLILVVVVGIIVFEFVSIRHVGDVELAVIHHGIIVFVIESIDIDHVDIGIGLVIIKE